MTAAARERRIKGRGLGDRRVGGRRVGATLLAGAALLGAIAVIATVGPFLLPDPAYQDSGALLAGPGHGHLLGTDQLGRDTLARLVSAARTDLRVAIGALVVPMVTGVTIGTLAGTVGGRLDTVLARLVDAVVAFPFYVLVIALVFAVGPGERGIYAAMAMVGWVGYARVTRNLTRIVVGQDWVLAARQSGLTWPRVVLRHIVPHTVTQAVVLAASDVVYVMVAVVTLGYLGLGIQPPTADWGTMIYDSRAFITTQWWLPALPGAAVVVTGLGFSLLADGLADFLRERR